MDEPNEPRGLKLKVIPMKRPINMRKRHQRKIRSIANKHLKGIIFSFPGWGSDKLVEMEEKDMAKEKAEKKEKKAREPTEKQIARQEKKEQLEAFRSKRRELAEDFIKTCEKEDLTEKQIRGVARIVRRITQDKE